MRNIALTLMYNGSAYHGWQVQKTEVSVAQTLERGLSMVCGHPVKLTGCGRTDAGVHAKAMAANAYMDTERTPDEVRDYMNRYLPDDICVQETKLAADRFHARYRAVGKLYTYTCYVGDTKPVFNR